MQGNNNHHHRNMPATYSRPLPAWRHWFSGRSAISNLPQPCVMDCSAPGQDVGEACSYWVKRLHLEAPPWLLREHLQQYGCWDQAELCDHQANLRRLLWVWACDCREAQDIFLLPYLGC